ncbi:E3 ubiquitin-protein ligase XIAP-like isoform X2 [Argiope bruennichi]|nr:E3 ubiquitin-protein ligase XIAP-like isoform X2 [Argiope bruennichi]XP_055949551.1 E3 ubiquitin-protein ligase XIAP-like isoform X2 [Argiope bruennichi]XP_055949552.1 E3 ubiquitin-protein ligase XIAP-like isoform X2 [Argiope bruennichi]XP_055949553.1 E3 ubiquitin-protein ligase XIAP-like isoform X2 [Argiope bruennichi]
MATHVAPLNLFNLNTDMAVLKDIPDQLNENRIEEIHKKTQDEIDKPSSYYSKRAISDENARNQELFDVMKYEVNRLNSFTGKWPLCFIKPKDLAHNGFFYLQSEDKVQCAFCNVIIDDWNVGDKPVKKHMMKNPKCEFLMTADAGNVPFSKPKPVAKNVSKCIPSDKARNSLPHKPRYPRMSDLKNRLLSFRDWPLLMLSSRQLAECGLFYTGVGDAVTCFYCGGSLGNWELNDDPWVEHEKFYPDCGFLSLVKTCSKPAPSFIPANHVFVKSNSASVRPSVVLENSVPNEVIRQASEIFPEFLVQEVAIQHFRKTNKHFTSLHDLCEAILQYKEQEQSALSPLNDSKKAVSGDVTSNKDEPTLPIFKCGEDGVSPNPRSCDSFIKCSHHLKYVVPCPEGLHFRNETGQCEKPCDAQCDQKLACECGWPTCASVCEERNGVYAHPDECEKFIKCEDGKPTVFECSKGKAFDINRKKCSSRNEVDCKIDSVNELHAVSRPP